MCGIVGFTSSIPDLNNSQLITMRDQMRHRGPDDAGVWWSPDGRVGLAQRRLAIIDLSPGGHQPMQDSSGQLCIAFNGEIYNYQDLREELESRGHCFHTASDTEVILEAYRAWGTDCLSHLNGMFAFGLYDRTARHLFLARDRAGEKPLFYWHTPGKLVFASELKAIMAYPAFPRELNLGALDFYLAYGYVPGELCMLKGVCKLPQGNAATYDIEDDSLRLWRYWRLPQPSARKDAPRADDLVDELEALLSDSVRRQLIADVPLGILLSGGTDSSLVTAIAARATSGPVKTFTVAFPGHGLYDETPYARLVAQHFGTQHTELEAEPATVEILPMLARQYDEPMADSSMVPTYLVSRLIRQEATVALGGDGGDELFGGYWHHSWIQQATRWQRHMPSSVRTFGRSVIERLPPGLKGRNYLICSLEDLPQRLGHASLFDPHTRNALLRPIGLRDGHSGISPEGYKVSLVCDAQTPLQCATALDFQTYLVDDILVKVDRASMLTSLEVRAPWLDYRIVEFAFGRVPDSLRATAAERKILPRLLAKRLLPTALDLTRKQGFSLPLGAWFRHEWGDFIAQVLAEAEPRLFDRSVVQSLIAGQRRGFSNTERLFALTIFELWRREYDVRV